MKSAKMFENSHVTHRQTPRFSNNFPENAHASRAAARNRRSCLRIAEWLVFRLLMQRSTYGYNRADTNTPNDLKKFLTWLSWWNKLVWHFYKGP